MTQNELKPEPDPAQNINAASVDRPSGVRLPFSATYGHIGLVLIGLLGFIDLYTKYFLVEIFRLGERGFVPVAPGFDFVLSKNPGVSFGLFPQNTVLGMALLAGFNLAVVAGLSWWLWRTESRWVLFGASFLAAGAMGNGLDRLVTGAVTDFIFFHIGDFQWYVFNFADVWIFIGAILILIDNIVAGRSSGNEMSAKSDKTEG